MAVLQKPYILNEKMWKILFIHSISDELDNFTTLRRPLDFQ